MGRVRASVVLEASPEAVWEFVTRPENFGAYVDGYVEGRVLTPQAVGRGARYEWAARLGPIRLRSEEAVVEWIEGERVRYAGTLAGVPFRSMMEVAPTGERAALLTVAIEFDLPRWLGGRAGDRLLSRLVVRPSVDRSLALLGRRFPPVGNPIKGAPFPGKGARL